MIEADIVMGRVSNDNGTENIPIMAHPPYWKSDLSLEMFMRRVLEYNLNNETNVKGVKLDFKSIDAFNGALPLLKSLWNSVSNTLHHSSIGLAQYFNKTHFFQMKYPIWINADILRGPVNAQIKPVNAKEFLEGCHQLPNATISPGWTTQLIPFLQKGAYSPLHINQMIEVLETHHIINSTHPVTFPVRAAIATQSKDTLINLLDRMNRTDRASATLTIWSSGEDRVNIIALRDLIVSIGVDRVYVDVPSKIYNKLNLASSASTLVHFGILNVITFTICTLLKKYALEI